MNFSTLAGGFKRIEDASKRIEMTTILAKLFERADPGEMDNIIYFCQESLAPPFYGLELGISVKLLTRAISEAANRSTQDVEEAYKDMGDLGLVAESMLPGKTSQMSVQQVSEELMAIAKTSGKGSQEHKINSLSSLLRGVSPEEARYVARFVIGRLRLGIGDPTVLEALSQLVLC